jgi:ribonuclease-3
MTSGNEAALVAVERRIGHTFHSRALLRTALTHTSAAPVRKNYQRYEFLGDRVLGLAVAEMLMEAFPEASEGDLSTRLAELVRKETCAEVAAALDLGSALYVGGGRAQKAAIATANVLADVCEAVIAAVFLDAGYEPARDFVGRNWRDRMLSARASRRDAKTSLQEWAHKNALPTPVYALAERRGPHHDSVFVVDVTVENRDAARGEGRTRREAEQAAAGALLLREGVWSPDK